MFVYHKEDHEGSMLAEVLRRLDRPGGMQFLAIDGPSTMAHMSHFLGPASSIRLPFLVVMTDLSGTAVHTHRVLHGETLTEWFHQVLRSAAEMGAMGVLREAILRHLHVATLSMIGLCMFQPNQQTSPPSTESPPPPPAATRPAPPAPPHGICPLWVVRRCDPGVDRNGIPPVRRSYSPRQRRVHPVWDRGPPTVPEVPPASPSPMPGRMQACPSPSLSVTRRCP